MKDKLLTMRGFTLVELMIVVAIIGILAAVAIPQYQQYTQDATVQAGLSEASQYKTAVAICAQTRPVTDCDAGTNGVPAVAGKVITVVDGKITVRPGAPFGTQEVLYTPNNAGSGWKITCTPSGTTPDLCTNSALADNPDFSG